jgi:hypothetical protein
VLIVLDGASIWSVVDSVGIARRQELVAGDDILEDLEPDFVGKDAPSVKER